MKLSIIGLIHQSKTIQSWYACLPSPQIHDLLKIADSDIDLAVFLDKDEIDGFREDVELMRLRWEIDLRIEPHAFARSDLDETNPYIWEIIHTGERIV